MAACERGCNYAECEDCVQAYDGGKVTMENSLDFAKKLFTRLPEAVLYKLEMHNSWRKRDEKSRWCFGHRQHGFSSQEPDALPQDLVHLLGLPEIEGRLSGRLHGVPPPRELAGWYAELVRTDTTCAGGGGACSRPYPRLPRCAA